MTKPCKKCRYFAITHKKSIPNGQCRRYPVYEKKHGPDDWCGEYTEALK